MTARADTSLTHDQLRSFADALGASKLEHFAREKTRLRARGETSQERYENQRDLAMLSIEAVRDRRAVFDEAALMRLSEQANIPPDAAARSLPALQRLMAASTAGYNIALTDASRPSARRPRRWRRWLFGPQVDHLETRYQELLRDFAALGLPVSIMSASDDGDDQGGATAEVEDLQPETATALRSSDPEDGHRLAQDAALAAPRTDPCSSDLAMISLATDDSSHGGETHTKMIQRTAAQGEDTAASQPLAPDSGALLFSTHWSRFVAEKIGSSEWSESRLPELAGSLNLVLKLIGDVEVLGLTRDQASLLRSRYFTRQRITRTFGATAKGSGGEPTMN